MDSAARATALMTVQYVAIYDHTSERCTEESDNWTEYDTCMEDAEAGLEAIQLLRDTTLTLQVARGRKGRKKAACAWYRAVEQTPPTPAREVALASKWRRKC